LDARAERDGSEGGKELGVRLYGLLVIRNEVDIIRTNILYHLSLGLDQLLIIDNGSSDGTERVLRELSQKDPRVRWTRDEGLWRAGDLFTRIAREAHREGADWVVPIDADEFWHAPDGSFRRVLEESEAGALRAPGLNFIQRREQEKSSPEALLHMTRRVPEPIAAERGNRKPAAELVESQQIASVEIEPVRKWISRPTSTIEMYRGNGRVEEVAGLKRVTDKIIRLHAILRSRARLKAKAEGGERSKEAGSKPNQSSHLTRWKRLRDEGRLEQEWAANSYAGEYLDVYGVRRKTVFDPTLRDVVAPFLENGRHEEEVLEKRPLWRRITKRI
jgi:glycosyltransferase involved in cell wall biosynthesis